MKRCVVRAWSFSIFRSLLLAHSAFTLPRAKSITSKRLFAALSYRLRAACVIETAVGGGSPIVSLSRAFVTPFSAHRLSFSLFTCICKAVIGERARNRGNSCARNQFAICGSVWKFLEVGNTLPSLTNLYNCIITSEERKLKTNMEKID